LAFSQSNQETCEALSVFVTGLTDETFNQPIMGTPPALTVTAKWYAATATVPEYCEVKGRIFPEIDFAVRMPSLAKWNRSAIHNGGGGWDGSIRSDPNDTTNAHVLDLGYPWSASDGGHDGNNGEFTVPDPYYQEFWPSRDPNPYACQKIVDMGNRAHRETPVLAKKIYKQYYGSFPVYTYYNGTSTGGREGLVEAQKNYDLFDGIYIGRPTGGHVAVCTRGIWDNVHSEPFALNHTVPPSDRVLYTGPTGNDPYYKAEALRAAVYDKCDGVDGLVDGVIDDPRKCNFDPLTDLPACPNDTEAARCFTLAQRQALKEIYRGPHDSQGNQYYVGQTLSAEWWTAPPPRYNFNFGAALLDSYANDMVRYTAWNQIYTAPPGPTWDMMTFNWDTDVQLLREATCTQYYPFDGSTRTYNIAEEMDAVTLSYPVKPNMGGFAPFKAKGGKIIHNHGWADALVSSLTSVSLYESVLQEMGIEETKNFWKLYMVPGMGHGSAGVGYPIDSWDNGFGALVKWVEKGVEPYELIGQRTNPAEKRLLCPYPEVARYSGPEGGSIWDPENFTCVPPIEVRIEPETLNLKSKGVFTAFITVPEGYDIRDWNIGNLECEGAKAVKGVFSANAYIAKFQTQDLVGVTHGDAVTLTVKGTFEVDGHTALIQADDTIRVIGNAPQKGKK
jgi:feruloyl esterase